MDATNARQHKDIVLKDEREARDAVSARREQLAEIGKGLIKLGRALQLHPEFVRPLPEPANPHDYRNELNLLTQRDKVVRLCEELPALEHKSRSATERKDHFGY